MAELAALIKKEGIAALSASEIAGRLRCSLRSLYKVAPTKEGLLLVVAQRQFEESLAAGHAAAKAESDPARQLVAYINAGLRTAQQLSTAYLSDLERLPEGRAIFDKYQLMRSEGARAILEDGVRKGVFKPLNIDVVSELLLGAAQRLRHAEFLERANLSLTQAFEEAYELAFSGLLVQAPAAKGHRHSASRSKHHQ